MKKNKLVATLSAVALLGVIGVGSTFAYLTDKTETINNTFTVGNVNFDDEFGSGLRESAVSDESGSYVDADGENKWTVISNEYENLYAGEVVYKDPTVIMGATSEDAWVFAKVTFDDTQYDIVWADGWTDVTAAYIAADAERANDKGYVVLAKDIIIKAGEHSTIFTEVTVDKDITEETTLTDISVSAFAIQAAGFDSYEAAISEVVFE